MFKGRSKHILDEKGRLAIPARFKEVLNRKDDDCLVLTNHYNCLWAFTRDDWQLIEEKAAGLSLLDQSVTRYLRYFISGAQECPLKQGRVTIPPDLREIAGLKKDVVLVGGLKIFEIWDREKWDEEFEQAKGRFPEVSQSLSGLGI
jgi:MraZ protein